MMQEFISTNTPPKAKRSRRKKSKAASMRFVLRNCHTYIFIAVGSSEEAVSTDEEPSKRRRKRKTSSVVTPATNVVAPTTSTATAQPAPVVTPAKPAAAVARPPQVAVKPSAKPKPTRMERELRSLLSVGGNLSGIISSVAHQNDKTVCNIFINLSLIFSIAS